MWEETTTTSSLTWKRFRDGQDRAVYIRVDLIEAFGDDWVQVENGRRYDGLVGVLEVMAEA